MDPRLYEVVKAYGREHGLYAGIDVNPQMAPKLILCKGNDFISRPLEGDVMALLDEMYRELGVEDIDYDTQPN